MEQNYRSTNSIVQAANSVIAKNKNQLKKKVFTENEEGYLLKVIKANTDNEEGQKIANHIFEIKAQNQIMNSDFAATNRRYGD